ncbi:amino acid ABC transporter permease (plasmid) [Roseomonas gilardii subsp. gilardii]|uniref:amino acid ABC transporter permease n=1 Tax=Roseomonas gilardii TaxID=257708 RepID=UPI001FFA582A|nr:amino acid ABC transporter permease [Roseomonas gilardii]UPG74766.1 amino acid ABC transporter permease [Roseomonas gilardii subsp. gilardii]
MTASSTMRYPAELPDALPIVHRRQWGGWILGAIALLLVLAVVTGGARARLIEPSILLEYIFSPLVLQGALNAVVLGTTALVFATAIGFISALMRLSGNPILVGLAAVYVYLFRGTPMLIQLIFWFNAVPTMLAEIHITLPFMETPLIAAPTTSVVTPFVAALAALSLAEGAYMSEIIRGGIQAVDQGQRAAARALGMTGRTVMAQVVVPQAGRIILPAVGNQYIMLLKSTSLASAIGYLELLRIVTDIYSSNFRVVELLTVAAFWYLVMTAFATLLQTALEKRYPIR